MASLTSSQKAQRTKAYNKADADYDLAIKPEYDAWKAELEIAAAERDSIIVKIETERNALIAKIEAEYQAKIDEAQAALELRLEPTSSALSIARAKAGIELLDRCSEITRFYNEKAGA